MRCHLLARIKPCEHNTESAASEEFDTLVVSKLKMNKSHLLNLTGRKTGDLERVARKMEPVGLGDEPADILDSENTDAVL